MGDSIFRGYARDGALPRGIFGLRVGAAFSDIRDGTSNTIMFSERLFGGDPWMIKEGIAQNVTALNPNTNLSPAACLTVFDPANPQRYAAAFSPASWSGRRWANGIPQYTRFNTVLPPNSPACNDSTWDERNAVLPPSSYHPGGVNAAMADASVRFVSETIQAGDPTMLEVTSGISPYGVWGAMGSRSGGESVSPQ